MTYTYVILYLKVCILREYVAYICEMFFCKSHICIRHACMTHIYMYVKKRLYLHMRYVCVAYMNVYVCIHVYVCMLHRHESGCARLLKSPPASLWLLMHTLRINLMAPNLRKRNVIVTLVRFIQRERARESKKEKEIEKKSYVIVT